MTKIYISGAFPLKWGGGDFYLYCVVHVPVTDVPDELGHVGLIGVE